MFCTRFFVTLHIEKNTYTMNQPIETDINSNIQANRELQLAWDFIEHTGRSIFLTGKAGTGKTTFLKRVVEESTKRSVVVAPTGVAAINAGGVTIHSFFQLPLSPFVPDAKMKSRFDFSRDKRKIIASLDLLIIDEISMVRADLLDAIDSVLRRFRNRYLPFGGIQLLMIGDLGQLTPVVTPEDEAMLRPYYATPYFFGSKALAQTDYVTIELKTVYRQHDKRFVELLNHVRTGNPSAEDLMLLNSRLVTQQTTGSAIRLCTHNFSADRINESQLAKLPTEAFTYTAEVKGTFPDYSYPTAEQLILKEGTQVMFVKNDASSEHRYYNGRIAQVTFLNAERVFVRCEGDDYDIEVEPQTWENAKYTLDAETRELKTDIQGTFTQLPLRLAWAITIHKSQGLTFEHAIIDANMSFAPGQVYVALSRCRSLEGLQLATPIESRAIINDPRVSQYIGQQEEAARQSIAMLPTLKEEFFRHLLLELFDFSSLIYKEEHLGRLLIEFFYNAFTNVTDLHKQSLHQLKKDVADVALKWRMAIGAMSTEQLHEEAFLERVKRSCTYFDKKLAELLNEPLALTKPVKSNNKEAMKRLGEALPDVAETLLSRRFLLQRMALDGFTTAGYLMSKRQSQVSAMDIQDGSAEKLEKKKKRKAKGKEKEKDAPKKENTRIVSYRMFLQGLTPVEIATERGLALSSVLSHLATYIETGELSAADIIGEQHFAAINKVIGMTGTRCGLKVIKALCPPDVGYAEIQLVVRGIEGQPED